MAKMKAGVAPLLLYVSTNSMDNSNNVINAYKTLDAYADEEGLEDGECVSVFQLIRKTKVKQAEWQLEDI